jgi:Holliday junction resolvase
MINSRQKGARGERAYAKWLRDNFGLEARRGQQFCGGSESPDVIGGFDNTHVEVKFVEKLSIEKAMNQAKNDCGDKIPYVAHKRNRSELLITVRASDLKSFAESVVKASDNN